MILIQFLHNRSTNTFREYVHTADTDKYTHTHTLADQTHASSIYVPCMWYMRECFSCSYSSLLSPKRFWHFVWQTQKCQSDNRQSVGNIAEWKNSIVALSDSMGSHCSRCSYRRFLWFLQRWEIENISKSSCESSSSEQLHHLKVMIAGIDDSTDSKISDWNEENRRYLSRVFQLKRDNCQICSIYLFDSRKSFQWKLDEFNVFHDPCKDISPWHSSIIFGCFFSIRFKWFTLWIWQLLNILLLRTNVNYGTSSFCPCSMQSGFLFIFKKYYKIVEWIKWLVGTLYISSNFWMAFDYHFSHENLFPTDLYLTRENLSEITKDTGATKQ